MPYIKKAQRAQLDPFIDNLAQAIGTEDIDGKLNYAISRLVAGGYAPGGHWSYSLIQRAVGLIACVGQELYHRVAVPYEAEAAARNGDIPEYDDADGQHFYRAQARQICERFPANGRYSRVVFDQLLANNRYWDRIDGFTNLLHADGYIVMGTETVTLGLKGLELRNAIN